jgi:type III restriction enzyme
MRQKEQLLSFSEHACFIFAHSALREGWDNPNVFQICTLNQTVSEVKKRQEIGRGLRLCVNQEGDRLFGDEVNILTVVANESYQSYAANLQQEYVESGDAAPPLPSDARKRQATRNDRIFLESKVQNSGHSGKNSPGRFSIIWLLIHLHLSRDVLPGSIENHSRLPW